MGMGVDTGGGGRAVNRTVCVWWGGEHGGRAQEWCVGKGMWRPILPILPSHLSLSLHPPVNKKWQQGV